MFRMLAAATLLFTLPVAAQAAPKTRATVT